MSSYEVSVIIPFYNVEDYLEECINSVINQSNFKSLYIILIDDGSTDSSAEICEKYVKKYSNIKYFYKENGGISSARNAGLSYVKGNYVIFLDSDDKFSPTAIETMLKAAKNNNADIVHGDLKIFPKQKEAYGAWKNEFGKGNKKITDITKHQDLLFNPSPCNKLFKRELFEGITFPEGMVFEDAYTIIPLMIKSKSIYLLDSIVYFYRKRIVNTNSIMDNLYSKKKNYYDHLNVNEHLFRMALKEDEKVQKSISRFILRSYNAFMVRLVNNDLFTIEEKYEIFNRLSYMYNKYPEEYFLEMGTNNKIRIMYYAIRTNNFDLFLNPFFEDPVINIVDNNMFFDLSQKDSSIRRWFLLARGFYGNLENIDIVEGGKLKFNGQFRVHCAKFTKDFTQIKVQVYVDGKPTLLVPVRNIFRKDLSNLFEENGTMNGFEFYIDINKLPYDARITFKFKFFDVKLNKYIEFPIGYQKTLFKRKGWYQYSYCTLHFAINIKSKEFVIFKYRKRLFVNAFRIRKYMKRMEESSQDFKNAKEIYEKYKRKLKNKKVWLIAERFDTAQDNSYFLFKWIRENYPREDVYYLIKKDSDQYEKVKTLGNVIDFDSEQHLGYLLNASVVVNSYDIDSYMIPSKFEKNKFYQLFGDLIKYKRVFLSHGINYNDQSIPLNNNRLLADLFITSQSIIEKQNSLRTMNYSEEQVRNIGLVRFDNLKRHVRNDSFKHKINQKKKILFMPTWRQYILPKSYGESLDENIIMEKKRLFLSSSYYRNLIDLMKNKELQSFLERKNIEFQFYPHYEVRQFLDCFKISHPNIKVLDDTLSVQELLIDCDAMITDYSSVFFDVAYMNKPLCYFQFDYDEFYSKHYRPGIFNFREDGFGPVCSSVNDVISAIMKINKNDFKNSLKYKKRIQKFFGKDYLELNHAESVYNAIKDLLKDSKEFVKIN